MLARQKRELLADAPDAAELRRKAKAFDDAEAANLSELEKANARAEAAELAASAATTSAKSVLRKAAITVAAKDTVDPDAVNLFLADDKTIIVGDDGTVTGAAEAIAALLEERPHLKGTGNGGGQGNGGNAGNGNGKFDGGARGGGGDLPTQSQLKTMSPEAIAKLTPEQVAAAMGRP